MVGHVHVKGSFNEDTRIDSSVTSVGSCDDVGGRGFDRTIIVAIDCGSPGL
jgi:hypothetical protein